MNGQVDASLRMGKDQGRRTSYPSPFFDVSQQYIPPTIKELFKWVYFYCTNNSFLGPALGKIARYPVTDLVLEDNDPQLVKFWSTLLNNTLQIKTFNMECNLDLTSYGNAFVTLHYPFARLLECTACKHRSPWKQVNKKIDNLVVKGQCRRCGNNGAMKMIDIPFKSLEGLRLIRINPEFIDIKYNETTARHTYMYSIPDRLKKQIMQGDPDIIEDTPQIYIEAIKHKRKIKLAHDNLFHLKNPTLAGKDMGWGMPRIATALKDLFHYYTLRRAQEAVMQEHIVPFDIIFPQANGKMDPYTNTDLASWKKQMERELANKRRDSNYKAILPFPVGYQRIGGDGKALMLTPEMDFLAKWIIGACGIPQEFVSGGTMNWSGSSVSLRTLENDFLHQRTQLLQMDIWLIERVRLYLGQAAPKSARFSDFKMADDMQKMQLMIGMAQSNRLPWEDIQREFGRDPGTVRQKLEEEAQFYGKIQQADMSRQAEGQARAQEIQQRYAIRQQNDPNGQAQNQVAVDKVTADTIAALAERLVQLPQKDQEGYLERVKLLDQGFADLLQRALQNLAVGHPAVPSSQDIQAQQAQQEQQNAQDQQDQQNQQAQQAQQAKAEAQAKANSGTPKNLTINMAPMPEQKPPRRQGGV